MAESTVAIPAILTTAPPRHREVKQVLFAVRNDGEFALLEEIKKQLEMGWFLYKIEGGNPVTFAMKDGKTILVNNDSGENLNLFFAVLCLTPQ